MTVKPGIAVGRDHFSTTSYTMTIQLFSSTAEAVSSLNSFSETASALGLRVLWPKTNLQNFATGTQPPAIEVDGNTVDSVDNFIYLDSVLSSDGYSCPDINRRIGLASSVMSALSHIWKNQRLSHKNPYLSGLSAIHITVRSENLDSSRCRFQSPRGIPYDRVPTGFW